MSDKYIVVAISAAFITIAILLKKIYAELTEKKKIYGVVKND